MPLTMATIGSCGLIGLPLFSGFIGKWYLLVGSLEAGMILPVVAILAGSVLCAAYLLPVIRTAYFRPAPAVAWRDPGRPQKLALLLLATAVVVLGVRPGPFLELARKAAAELMAFV